MSDARSPRRPARLAQALFAAVLVVWFAAPVASRQKAPAKTESKTERQKELTDLRSRMDKLRAEVSSAESQRGEAADALKTSERAISDANRNLFELAAAQKELGAEQKRITEQTTQARAQVELQRQRLAQLLVHQYQHGSSDALQLYFEGRNLAEAERQARYLDYVSRERRAMMDRLKVSLGDLAQLEQSLTAKQQELASNESEQRAARQKLETERKTRRKVLNDLAGDITKGRREIGKLKRDEDRLSRLIEQLGRALKSVPPASGAKPGQSVEQAADPSLAGLEFASVKGKLRLPVKGELISRFGSPREGISSKGLFIRTQTGQPIHVVADGRVVYVDWMRGLGNVVIVDHGKSYISIYGNTESVLKQVGDRVKSGDAVASAGDSGGAGESGVYFELRFQGQPFDPMRWVKR